MSFPLQLHIWWSCNSSWHGIWTRTSHILWLICCILQHFKGEHLQFVILVCELNLLNQIFFFVINIFIDVNGRGDNTDISKVIHYSSRMKRHITRTLKSSYSKIIGQVYNKVIQLLTLFQKIILDAGWALSHAVLCSRLTMLIRLCTQNDFIHTSVEKQCSRIVFFSEVNPANTI